MLAQFSIVRVSRLDWIDLNAQGRELAISLFSPAKIPTSQAALGNGDCSGVGVAFFIALPLSGHHQRYPPPTYTFSVRSVIPLSSGAVAGINFLVYSSHVLFCNMSKVWILCSW